MSLRAIKQPTNTNGKYPNCTERELHTWNATHDANSTETNSMTNVCSLYCFLLISIFVYFTMQRYCDFSKKKKDKNKGV